MSMLSRFRLIERLGILSVLATVGVLVVPRGGLHSRGPVNLNPDNTRPIAALLPDWRPTVGGPAAQIVFTSRQVEPRGSHSLHFVLLNSGNASLYFSGYSPDSYRGGMPVGQIGPVYSKERKVGEKWQKVVMGWCGTGMEQRRLLPGQAGYFRVFPDPDEPTMRIGVPLLRTESASYREAEIVWSPTLAPPREE